MSATRTPSRLKRAPREWLRPVVFQHIPKTAGVSLRSVMACNFRAHEILHVPDARWKDRRYALTAAERYRFIHGHLHYEFLRDIIHGSRAITFLRHPVDRILSLYFFLRSQSATARMSPGARLAIEEAKLKAIDEFVGDPHPIIGAMITNYQVQMFLSNAQIDRGERTWVSCAIANLKEYAFVGIADADLLPRSVTAMAQTFGWVVTSDAPHVNQTSRSRTARQLAHARRLIADRNELDLALYERVRTRLLKLVKPGRAQKARARKVARAQVGLYRTGLTTPVTMDQPLRGFGWHDREVADRQCWRCAAQLRVGLDLKLPHEPRVVLLFNLKSAHPRIAIEETELLVGRRVLPSRMFLAENSLVIATLIRGRAVGTDGILSIVIRCKEGRSKVGGKINTADSRYVSFALETIDVITETSAGPRALALLEQWLTEPAHLQALTSGLEAERAARSTEQAQAAQHAAALVERAERSEAYCASLVEELKRLQAENRALLEARAADHAVAERHSAALIERIEASQTYCSALSEELRRQQAEKVAVLEARAADHVVAERHSAALIERIEASQTYCSALSEELRRQQAEKVAALEQRAADHAVAERHSAALIERIEASQTYCSALSEELRRQQAEKVAVLEARLEEKSDAERYQTALLERAQRSETYSASLLGEIARLREENRALLEHERAQTALAAAAPQYAAEAPPQAAAEPPEPSPEPQTPVEAAAEEQQIRSAG